MKTLHKLAIGLCLALGLAVGSARATTFEFSYTFGDINNPLVVTGTLDGNLDVTGLFVEGVQNVSLFFNGDAALGTVFTSQYNGNDFVSGPVVAFDVTQNNFYFTNTDFANADFTADTLFYISGIDGLVGAQTPVLGSVQESPLVAGNWSLTAVNTVPENSGTFVLFGTGLGFLCWIRRKFTTNGNPVPTGLVR